MRILLVVSRFPWPSRRGDQVRAVQFADLLADDHEVTLLAPEPGDRDEAEAGDPRVRRVLYRVERPAAAAGVVLAGLRGQPLQSGLFRQPHLGRRLRHLAPTADLVVLQLVRLAAHAADLGATPYAVDLIDSLSLNFSRRASFDHLWMAPLLAHEARRLAAAEDRLLAGARAGLLVSARDRTWLGERLSPDLARRLAVVPLVVPLPPPAGEPGGAAADDAPRLVFTGNLGYFANADAVTWWLRDVWPAVRAGRPELELVVAGARPPARVRTAARATGVRLVDSPADLGTILAGASVAIAPLRAGSGVPVKVLEAWAAGVPVVASRWAAAGAAGSPDRDLLLAETVEEWREAIGRLLDDDALRQRLVRSARHRVATENSREAVRAALGRALAG